MSDLRALMVDDSSVMRKIVERSLRQADIDLKQVFEASNGAEVLTVLRDNQVDVILCDINMPVMDGLEFVKQLASIETVKFRAPSSTSSSFLGLCMHLRSPLLSHRAESSCGIIFA